MELAALDGVVLELGLLGNLGHAVVEDLLLRELLLLTAPWSEPCRGGRTPTQTPQPMQSSGETAMA